MNYKPKPNTRARSHSGTNNALTPVRKHIRKFSKDSDFDESSSFSESNGTRKRSMKVWKSEEDDKLIEYFRIHKGNWKLIAQEIPGRNASQCAQRWKRMNPIRVIFVIKQRKQWNEEEDHEVSRLVAKYGRNWKRIETEMQGRTGKQIRERFINKLDPHINHEKFTEDEDVIIYEHYKLCGPKWSEISKKLQGRPENMVKNRFYSYIKRVYFNDNGLSGEICNEEGDNCDSQSDEGEVEVEDEDQKNQFFQPFLIKPCKQILIVYIQDIGGQMDTIQSQKEDFDSLPKPVELLQNDSGVAIGAYNRPSYQRKIQEENDNNKMSKGFKVLNYFKQGSIDSNKGPFNPFLQNKQNFEFDDNQSPFKKHRFQFSDAQYTYQNLQMPSLDPIFPNDEYQQILTNHMGEMSLEQNKGGD